MFIPILVFSNKIQFKEDHCSKRWKRKKQEVKRKPEKMFELKFFFCNYLRRMFNYDDIYIHFFILRFKYMQFIYSLSQNLISLFTDHPLYFPLQSLSSALIKNKNRRGFFFLTNRKIKQRLCAGETSISKY